MIDKIIAVLSILFYISCSNERSSNIDNLSTLDTITLFNVGNFLECSNPTFRTLLIDLQKPFTTKFEISFNGGTTFKKGYIREDSISVIIFQAFIATSFFDKDRMFSNVDGLTNDMVLADTFIETPQYKMSKTWGVDGNKAVLYYVVFDEFGYFSLNIIDDRAIPIQSKIDNIEKIHADRKVIELPMPSSQINGTVDTLSALEKCDWCIHHFCKLVSNPGAKDEILIMIYPNEYASFLDLELAASCLVENYVHNNQIKYIGFMEKYKNSSTFHRLAQFKVNTCIYENEDFTPFCNYVDCVWLDSTLGARLYDDDRCKEWRKLLD